MTFYISTDIMKVGVFTVLYSIWEQHIICRYYLVSSSSMLQASSDEFATITIMNFNNKGWNDIILSMRKSYYAQSI